ncbi:MAG TPA: glycerate dehydrogenase [Phycisphaerales bacterium]|nr:glycerate dehydrogenase [Phycisphaerales bacterium]HCD33202.1 glycerate dehydrogenase [Phycisphaerales bacterium]|tara:strand:+ start:145 stop:1113 length:969 start_codon:yes stop_codon:yes gene_type:complete
MSTTVCLDGFTANPGDLSWEQFQSLGTFINHDRTSATDLVSRSLEADALLTNKTVITADAIAQLPKLKYIGVLATGYNVVDTAAAKAHGVTVTNVPAYSTHSVAQLATGLMLELASRVGAHDRAVHDGQWVNCDDFCFTVAPLTELHGKTLGLIGFGQIGLAFARIAHAMGMNIIAANRSTLTPDRTGGLPITQVSVAEAFAQSDVLSLHCPLTDDTKHLVNAASLVTMKKTAFVLNTGRGPLVDAQALADALANGIIAGAGLDVLDAEPPQASDPLLTAPNCVITPHIAWDTREARTRLLDTAFKNLKAFKDGKPQNVVIG